MSRRLEDVEVSLFAIDIVSTLLVSTSKKLQLVWLSRRDLQKETMIAQFDVP